MLALSLYSWVMKWSLYTTLNSDKRLSYYTELYPRRDYSIDITFSPAVYYSYFHCFSFILFEAAVNILHCDILCFLWTLNFHALRSYNSKVTESVFRILMQLYFIGFFFCLYWVNSCEMSWIDLFTESYFLGRWTQEIWITSNFCYVKLLHCRTERSSLRNGF
jgi:hypothetical protein